MNEINYPFVSICTPTYNRRPFIPFLIKCIENQLYPKDKIEWIIVDDGTDSIYDLVKDLPFVNYIRFENRMPLGYKRNVMNSHSIGEYIVYMDDDDYYPPTRIHHAITTLLQNPAYFIAGSSELLIYYNHLKQIWKFGSSGKYHATAATFAFHKKLLRITSFENNQSKGEEKHFLKNFTIPLIQLQPSHTILVFSHIFNTFDKKILLKNSDNIYSTNYDPYTIISDDSLQNFYLRTMTPYLMYYKYNYLSRLHHRIKNKNDDKVDPDPSNQIIYSHDNSEVERDFDNKKGEDNSI
jgi:glycosyltransferase involved in cell wall biosynthesis